MSWQTQLNANPLPWLLEAKDPGVRYLALRDIGDSHGAELKRARGAAHTRGPISVILRNMEKEGYWAKPGPGYNPKYRSTVWSMIALAQLGASVEADKRIAQACRYVLDHSLAEGGKFTSLTSGDPSGTIDCLQGNLCWALLEMGCEDPRLDGAFDWMARTVTGEGIAPASEADASWRRGMDLPPGQSGDAPRHYYAYKSGPTFTCGVNGNLPCAWGGVKVMLAFSRLAKKSRTPRINRAIRHGVKFLFSVDPATAAYPTRLGDNPSRNWWKFGFPVLYVTDLLQLAETLIALGYAHDRRLVKALQVIREKQDDRGRWPFEFDYTNGKMWQDFGKRGQPNKWVTLRALRVLKAASA